MELKDFTTFAQGVAAVVAVVVGSYTVGDKFGLFERNIVIWSPEHFSIKATTAHEPILVTVARIKKRDDCSVEKFTPLIRDANNIVHNATTSTPVFSGPAGTKIDTFTYELILNSKERVASGQATLLASIKYKCPEGERVVQYPDHANLKFMLR